MKTRTKKRKTKTKIKTKKRIYNKYKRGGNILGTGASGCVIDSLSCGKLSRENGYVAKILNKNVDINIPLQNKLAEIDPDNKRFNRYHKDDTCEIEGIINNTDIKACLQKGLKLDKHNIVFQRYLVPLEESHTSKQQMTKSQYRYLRESLDILHKNKILHNDLPDNVMIDPYDNMPRIIDWDNASFFDNDSFAAIDYNAFVHRYQVKK
jgi:hypothetical protein